MRIHMFIFCITLAVILPQCAYAEEATDPPLFDTESFFTMELNLLDSGNSKVFSPSDQEAPGHDTQNFLSGKDRRRIRQRHAMHLRITGEYVDIRAKIIGPTNSIGATPDAVIGEVTALAPIDFLIPYMRIGYYHESDHNIADDRYGDGTNLDGVQFRFSYPRATDSARWLADAWYTYLYNGDKSPYIFTGDTIQTDRRDLGEYRGIVGLELHRDTDALLQAGRALVNIGDGGAASLEGRYDLLWNWRRPVFFGWFVQYGRNLMHAERFGDDEIQTGPALRIDF